jgi:hypothetical protein
VAFNTAQSDLLQRSCDPDSGGNKRQPREGGACHLPRVVISASICCLGIRRNPPLRHQNSRHCPKLPLTRFFAGPKAFELRGKSFISTGLLLFNWLLLNPTN